MFSFWRCVYKYNAVSLTGRKSLSGAQWRSAAHPQTSGAWASRGRNTWHLRPAAPITLRALPGTAPPQPLRKAQPLLPPGLP